MLKGTPNRAFVPKKILSYFRTVKHTDKVTSFNKIPKRRRGRLWIVWMDSVSV